MQAQRQFLDITQRNVSIELPESFVNRRVEVIVLTVDEDVPSAPKQRRPHPDIAGKGRTLGNLIDPVVAEDDWECLK